jgi:hypothetical protein
MNQIPAPNLNNPNRQIKINGTVIGTISCFIIAVICFAIMVHFLDKSIKNNDYLLAVKRKPIAIITNEICNSCGQGQDYINKLPLCSTMKLNTMLKGYISCKNILSYPVCCQPTWPTNSTCHHFVYNEYCTIEKNPICNNPNDVKFSEIFQRCVDNNTVRGFFYYVPMIGLAISIVITSAIMLFWFGRTLFEFIKEKYNFEVA